MQHTLHVSSCRRYSSYPYQAYTHAVAVHTPVVLGARSLYKERYSLGLVSGQLADEVDGLAILVSWVLLSEVRSTGLVTSTTTPYHLHYW